MKIKTLLLFVFFLITSIVVNGQNRVLTYGFETTENADDGSCGFKGWDHSENYNTIIGHQDVSKSRTGSGCLYVKNETHEGAFWARENVMKKVPVKDNTSYRITFYMKGDNSVKEGDERGRFIFNPQVQSNGGYPSINAGPQNDFNIWDNSDFNIQKWTRKTLMVYYSTDAFLGNIDPGYIRLVWNIFTKGEYIVDDITMDESTIAGVRFKDEKVEVDFGYKIDLTSSESGTATLPLDAFQVKVNGTPVRAISAAMPVQKLNITLEKGLKSTDVVTVDFLNTEDENKRLYYLEQKHPGFNDANDSYSVHSFTNEKAYYDAELVFEELPVEPIYTEILQNGNLESSFYSTEPTVMVQEKNSSEAHGGDKFLKILANNTANIYDRSVFLNASPIKKDKEYILSFWAKSLGEPTNIGLCLLNNNYASLNPDYSTWKTMSIVGSDWKQYSYTVTALVDEDKPFVSIQGGNIANNVYVDDVSLKVKSETTDIINSNVNSNLNAYVSNGYLYITATQSKVEIISSTGMIVKSVVVNSHEVLDLSGLSSGIYFVRFYGGKTVKILK